MRQEARRKELEALRLQVIEAKRERKLREMEEQKALREQIMRKKMEEGDGEAGKDEKERGGEETERGRES